MIELYIDGQRADIDQRADISVSLSISSLTATDLGRASYSKSVTIPRTPLNMRLMGDCDHPHSASLFNRQLHSARIEADGCVIIEGIMMLTSSTLGPAGCYKFNIIGQAKEWALSARGSLRSLIDDYSVEFGQLQVLDSWNESDALVRYLPVERDRKVDLPKWYRYARKLSTDDYNPFLHLRSVVEAIFRRAGYGVSSEFLDSDFFSSLYVSGRWRERDVTALCEGADFLALRSKDSDVVEGNDFGRVYADHLANYNTVGNLVDVWSPESGGYNCGDVFGVDSTGRICFRPSSPARVAFEYSLDYLTDVRIDSRSALRGFNVIHFGLQDEVAISLPNNHFDCREWDELVGDMNYSLAIFCFDEQKQYRVVASVDGTRQVLCHPTERFTSLTIPATGTYSNLELQTFNGTEYVATSEDWALYYGYVSEYSQEHLRCVVRSAPYLVTPSEGYYFDGFYFGGAEAGMTMQLLSGCSVRPLFVTSPIEGEVLEWQDVADYDFSQLDLIAALVGLFDLQIYTDTSTRTVYIAPRKDFCKGDVVVDLSERIDFGRGVVVQELGAESARTFTVAYRPTDSRSQQLAQSEGVPYGSWSAQVDNIFARSGEECHENPLLAASVSVTGSLPLAPSVSLIAVGNVGEAHHKAALPMAFDPKIVSFRRMQMLGDGEFWEWPGEHDGEYPLLEFFSPNADEPISLLFEERDGVAGLGSTYWRGRVEAMNHSRRLTLYVRLHPEEFESIIYPNSSGRDFRALYALQLEGERVLCRLEEIIDYNPSAPSTKCVFVTLS